MNALGPDLIFEFDPMIGALISGPFLVGVSSPGTPRCTDGLAVFPNRLFTQNGCEGKLYEIDARTGVVVNPSLSGAVSAELAFDHYLAREACCDSAVVSASADEFVTQTVRASLDPAVDTAFSEVRFDLFGVCRIVRRADPLQVRVGSQRRVRGLVCRRCPRRADEF